MNKAKSILMTTRFLLFSAVLLISVSATSQDIIRDVARLQALLPNSDLRGSTVAVSPVKLDTILAILAMYGRADLDDAQVMRNPQDILDVYRTNPFIYPLLSREGIFKQIRKQKVSLDSLQKQIPGLRNPAREGILRQLSANDVYTDKRMLSIPVLQAEYATPPPRQREVLSQQTDALKDHAAYNPSSLASKVLVGLVDWIAERAQDEFINTFMSRLQEDLEKKNLHHLFPSTSKYLNKLDVANYRTIIPNAKQVFEQDLRSLSLNVSNYLYNANRLSDADPAAFNFLLVFRLIDLSQRGVPLNDILAYARGDMGRRRFETEQSINLQLGQRSSEDAYKNLQANYQVAVTQLTKTYDLLKAEENRLLNIYVRLPPNTISAFFKEYDTRIRSLRQELREVQYKKLFDGQNGQNLTEAIKLLDGTLDYKQLKADPAFKIFEQKFLEQTPPSAATNRAIGLSMTRHLLRSEADTIAVLRSLYDYYNSLRELKNEVYQLKDSIAILAKDTSIQNARTFLLNQAKLLEVNLGQEKTYWSNLANVIEHDRESIDYLLNLVQDTRVRANTFTLSELETNLNRLKQLTTQQVQYLNAKYPSTTPSPLTIQPTPPEVDVLHDAIDTTALLFSELKQSLAAADTIVEQPLRRTYENAARFETILEVLTQLMYCFYLPEESTYLNPIRLNSLLNNNNSRQLFLGLVYQRISKLPNLGPIAPNGIASLSSSLVQNIADYGSSADSTATQRLVNKVQLVSNALNAVMETPLLLTNFSSQAQSMQQAIPAFRKVPPVNRELTRLFVLCAQGEYRYAVNHVLNLIDLFNAYPSAQKRIQKLKDRLESTEEKKSKILAAGANGTVLSINRNADTLMLNKRIDELSASLNKELDTTRYNRFRNSFFLYGHFIADVATANSTDQIKSAIASVALPQGSSQNKRQQWTSVELNAYFGGSFAYEHLLSDEVSNRTRLNNFSLFVPVGLSISRRLSQKSEFSMSIFLPIIDLGTLTAYRTDPKNQGERLPDITFGNVLSPGAHLFLNFGKSPFFIGAGLQYGPNTRNIEINQIPTKVEAMRYMLTFGIDVPILSFSRRL